MAAAPFAGYELVLVEPAMGFHQGRHLMLAAGVHLVKPLAATRNPAGGVRAVAAAATGYGVAVPPAPGSLPAATGGFGAGAKERASRGPRFVCAAAGLGDSPAALAAVSYSSTGQAGANGRPSRPGSTGVLAGPTGSGRFRAMSVVAKAGDDEPTDPEYSALDKVEEKEPGSNEEEGRALYFPCMPYHGTRVLEFVETAERGMALMGLLLGKEAYSPSDLSSVDWADRCVRRVLLQANEEGYVLAENVVEAAHSLAMVYLRLAARRGGVVPPFPKLPIEVPASLSTADIAEVYYEILSEDFANAVAAVEIIV